MEIDKMNPPAVVIIQEQGVEAAAARHDWVEHAEPLALLKVKKSEEKILKIRT